MRRGRVVLGIVVILGAAAAVLIGNGLGGADEPSPTTSDGLLAIRIPECDDSGSCAAGVLIGGRFYGMGDDLLQPGAVTEWIVARRGDGEPRSAPDEGRAVRGFEPEDVIAVRFQNGWRAAIRASGPPLSAQQRAQLCGITVTTAPASPCGSPSR